MDSLRWILLLTGVLVLVAIYVWGRRQEQRQERYRRETPLSRTRISGSSPPTSVPANIRHKPLASIADDYNSDPADVEEELAQLEELIASASASKPKPAFPSASQGEEKIIVMYVTAPEGLAFPGVDLYRTLQDLGLTYGDMKIYHRLSTAKNASASQAVFSVANMLEPGTFAPGANEFFSTLGVIFFMRMPTSMDDVAVFENMLSTAERLADVLDGEVRDEHRELLTPQIIEHLREEVRNYQFRQQAAQGSQ